MKRNLIFSPEYIEFEQSSNPRTREKLRYAVAILETVQPIPTKFVKKLTNTDFYELRHLQMFSRVLSPVCSLKVRRGTNSCPSVKYEHSSLQNRAKP